MSPCPDTPLSEKGCTTHAEPPRGEGQGPATVLLVDDDAAVRRVAARSLAMLGYAVVQAADAEAALGLVRAGGHFDLVLSDIALPGMRGSALLRELHASRPGLRVVLMTGFAWDALNADAPLDAPLLAKPFTIEDLRTCLERVRADATCERSPS